MATSTPDSSQLGYLGQLVGTQLATGFADNFLGYTDEPHGSNWQRVITTLFANGVGELSYVVQVDEYSYFYGYYDENDNYIPGDYLGLDDAVGIKNGDLVPLESINISNQYSQILGAADHSLYYDPTFLYTVHSINLVGNPSFTGWSSSQEKGFIYFYDEVSQPQLLAINSLSELDSAESGFDIDFNGDDKIGGNAPILVKESLGLGLYIGSQGGLYYLDPATSVLTVGQSLTVYTLITTDPDFSLVTLLVTLGLDGSLESSVNYFNDYYDNSKYIFIADKNTDAQGVWVIPVPMAGQTPLTHWQQPWYVEPKEVPKLEMFLEEYYASSYDLQFDGFSGKEKVLHASNVLGVNKESKSFIDWSDIVRDDQSGFGYLKIGDSALLLESHSQRIDFVIEVSNFSTIRLQSRYANHPKEDLSSDYFFYDSGALDFGIALKFLAPQLLDAASNATDSDIKTFLQNIANGLNDGVGTLEEYDQVLPVLKAALSNGSVSLALVLEPFGLSHQADNLKAAILALPSAQSLVDNAADSRLTTISISEGESSGELLLVRSQNSFKSALDENDFIQYARPLPEDWEDYTEYQPYYSSKDIRGERIIGDTEALDFLKSTSYQNNILFEKIEVNSDLSLATPKLGSSVYYIDAYSDPFYDDYGNSGDSYLIKAAAVIDWRNIPRLDSSFGYLSVGSSSAYLFELESGYAVFVDDLSQPLNLWLEAREDGTQLTKGAIHHNYGDYDGGYRESVPIVDFLSELDSKGLNFSTYLSGLVNVFPSLADGVSNLAEYDQVMPALKAALASGQLNLGQLLPPASQLQVEEVVRDELINSLGALILSMPQSQAFHEPNHDAYVLIHEINPYSESSLYGYGVKPEYSDFWTTDYYPIMDLEAESWIDFDGDGYIGYWREINQNDSSLVDLSNGPANQYVAVNDSRSEIVLRKAPISVMLSLDTTEKWGFLPGRQVPVARNVGSKQFAGTGEVVSLLGMGKYNFVASSIPEASLAIELDDDSAFFLHDAYSAFASHIVLSPDSAGQNSAQRAFNIDSISMNNSEGGASIVDLTSKDYVTGAITVFGSYQGRSIFWGSDSDDTFISFGGDSIIFGGAGSNSVSLDDGRDVLQYRLDTNARDRIIGFDSTTDRVEIWLDSGDIQVQPSFAYENGSTLMTIGSNSVTFLDVPDLALSSLNLAYRGGSFVNPELL